MLQPETFYVTTHRKNVSFDSSIPALLVNVGIEQFFIEDCNKKLNKLIVVRFHFWNNREYPCMNVLKKLSSSLMYCPILIYSVTRLPPWLKGWLHNNNLNQMWVKTNDSLWFTHLRFFDCLSIKKRSVFYLWYIKYLFPNKTNGEVTGVCFGEIVGVLRIFW